MVKFLPTEKFTWVNIDTIDNEAIEYLQKNHNFHHLDIENIQGDKQTPKIDIYKNYLFLVLHIPHWKVETETIVPVEVDIFINENFLITIQHGKSKTINNFFYRCRKNRSIRREWMKGSTGYLLYQLVEALFKNTSPILNNINSELNSVEEDIFSENYDTKAIRQLAYLRRDVLNFRRIIDPQRHLIAKLAHVQKPFLSEETSIYFDDVNDYLNKLWSIVERYIDTINGLHVTTESIINQRTNRVISALTIISVSLLPLNLLSGIYGMNIDRLPFAHSPNFVWGIYLVLIILIFSILIYGKKKRWL